MNERRSIEVIKNGCPKKITSPFSSDKKWLSKEITSLLSSDQKWSSKEITLLFNNDKNDRLKKPAHFQAMIPRLSKKTFKRQILRGRHRNTDIPKEKVVDDKEA